MSDDEELQELRRRAELVGIRRGWKMTAEQLRIALAERHRGLDPKQAEERATGEQH